MIIASNSPSSRASMAFGSLAVWYSCGWGSGAVGAESAGHMHAIDAPSSAAMASTRRHAIAAQIVAPTASGGGIDGSIPAQVSGANNLTWYNFREGEKARPS